MVRGIILRSDILEVYQTIKRIKKPLLKILNQQF